jgi:hypothetical protein
MNLRTNCVQNQSTPCQSEAGVASAEADWKIEAHDISVGSGRPDIDISLQALAIYFSPSRNDSLQKS